ncbi:MAG: galactose mutarotase [Actinomycetota bacterium]|nr:galactose mutarotase [Actinomycetota bacterium]
MSSFGITSATLGVPGVEVHVVELSSAALTVRLSTLGAAITSVRAPDADGRTGEVHLSLPSLEDYEDPERNPHLGASIGRYANRIADARFRLDDAEVRVVANDGPNHLHGGASGFDRHVWELRSVDDGEVGGASGVGSGVGGGSGSGSGVGGGGHDGGAVTFRFVSPDGDQGFPGTLTVDSAYELRGDSLRITYRSTTDAPTVVNLTNHGYWNLEGSDTITGHRLSIAADRYLPVDDAGIPTGGLIPVEGTRFDLRHPTELGTAMASSPTGGFDECFAVDGAAGRLRPAAFLQAPESGRWMTVASNQPGIQLYTGDQLTAPFRPHASVSLETQRFPDTPNRPELGSAVLRPGAVDESITVLRFGAGAVPAEGLTEG